MRLRWAAAFLALLIHNAEELLLNLPAWAAAQPQWRWAAGVMPEGRFQAVVMVLTLLALLLAIVGTVRPTRWTEALLLLLAGVMLFNAATHIVVSLLARAAMPGVVTSVVLVLPVMLWILASRPRHAP